MALFLLIFGQELDLLADVDHVGHSPWGPLDILPGLFLYKIFFQAAPFEAVNGALGIRRPLNSDTPTQI